MHLSMGYHSQVSLYLGLEVHRKSESSFLLELAHLWHLYLFLQLHPLKLFLITTLSCLLIMFFISFLILFSFFCVLFLYIFTTSGFPWSILPLLPVSFTLLCLFFHHCFVSPLPHLYRIDSGFSVCTLFEQSAEQTSLSFSEVSGDEAHDEHTSSTHLTYFRFLLQNEWCSKLNYLY